MAPSSTDAQELERLLQRVRPFLRSHANVRKLTRRYEMETWGQWDIPLDVPEVTEHHFDEEGIVLIDRYVSFPNGKDMYLSEERTGTCLVLLVDGRLAETERKGRIRNQHWTYWEATMRRLSTEEALARYGLRDCVTALTQKMAGKRSRSGLRPARKYAQCPGGQAGSREGGIVPWSAASHAVVT